MDITDLASKARTRILLILVFLIWTKEFWGIFVDTGAGVSFANEEPSPPDLDICDEVLSSLIGEKSSNPSNKKASSETPIKLIFNRRNYLPDVPLKVTVNAEDDEKKFWLLQARDLLTNSLVGGFNLTAQMGFVKMGSCEGASKGEMNTVTARQPFNAYWIPPDGYNGTVLFRVVELTSNSRVSASVEIIPYSEECFDFNGSPYKGIESRSKSGSECLRWDSSEIRNISNSFFDEDFVSNYCRSYRAGTTPGCYIRSNGIKFEVCDIPKCSNFHRERFIKFGEAVKDDKLPRSQQPGQVNFTTEFPMVGMQYSYATIFEDGVIILGTDYKTLERYRLWSNGTFDYDDSSDDGIRQTYGTGVIAPFWTNIRRQPNRTGQGFVYFRQLSEPDVLLRLGERIDQSQNVTGENFSPIWALVVTWHLVSDNASSTDVAKLSTFQAVLMTDGNASFVLFAYDMRDLSEEEKTASVGYTAANGLKYLNLSLNEIQVRALYPANYLGRIMTQGSTDKSIKEPGQSLYHVSPPAPGMVVVGVPYPPKEDCQDDHPNSPSRGDQNPCQDVDCGQKGECDHDTGDCICCPGFTGDKCEVNINKCDSDPCQNRGVCTDGPNSYHCECRPGYTGSRCEHNINDCLVSPCRNGGICEDGENTYMCRCPPAYTGRNCESLIDQCSSDPCQKNEKCVSSGGSYICECQDGYFGHQCQFRYCVNNRTCEDFHDCLDVNSGTQNCTCSETVPEDGTCPEAEPQIPQGSICLSSVTRHDMKGDILWPTSISPEIAVVSCPSPSTRNATRQCVGSGYAEPDLTNCDPLNPGSMKLLSLTRGSVTAENASDVASQILNITHSSNKELIAYDIDNIANLLSKVVNADGVVLARGISQDIISSISNIIDAPPEEIHAASTEFSTNSKFLRVIDTLLLKMEIENNEEYVESNNIKAAVSKIGSHDNFTGISFSLSSDKMKLSNDGVQNQTDALISLPSSIISLIPGSVISNRVQFAVHMKTTLFQNANMPPQQIRSDMMPNFALLSQYVISASVGDHKISDLAENVTITLPKTATDYYGNGPYCVYYKHPLEAETESWSREGCSLKENAGSSITCECNHLTNFAAIMDVYGTVEYFDDYQQKILQILTYIGCGLSIFGLLSTLISYTIFEKIRKEAPAKILISLCTALIAVNVVYLFMHSAYYSTPTTCVVVAAIMHYALLSSLAWMGVEAINMYIALVKVFNTYYRRYMLKMSLIGWGLPLLVVSSAFVVQVITEVPSYQMNSKTEICWLRREVFYGTLVAPFGIIFLFNIIIYCLVLCQLLGMSSRKLKHLDSARRMRRPAKRENVRKIRGAIGLMALLGISWGFALGTIDKAALYFSYVFVVFNSSQGFWVFLFHCVLKKEVSRAWKKLLCRRGRKFGDGSWSRFSSSNSKTTGTTRSTRSLSSSSIRASYLVPKQSTSIDRSEVSIGLDSNGTDCVTRSVSEVYANPVFDEPDTGSPPPYAPPPIPAEERKVRRVFRKSEQGPMNTIATQTDTRFLESSESDSDTEERRDSVDDTFVPRGGVLPHRRVQMSPSNESGVYSDTSVSSIAYPSAHHRVALRHHNIALRTDDVSLNVGSLPSESSHPVAENVHHDTGNGDNLPADKRAPLREDSKATDSGFSTSSDQRESPGTSRDVRPELLTNSNRASFYSTHSRDSDCSTPSSESDITSMSGNTPNPAPHLWKAPLVIKRKEGATNSGDRLTKMSKEGKIKRGLWKKHHYRVQHASADLNIAVDEPFGHKDGKTPKFQSLDGTGTDAKVTTLSGFKSNSLDDEML